MKPIETKMKPLGNTCNSTIAIANNIAKYYEATSMIERKLKGETMIEVITPWKKYQYFGTRIENDKRWNKINFIETCVRDFQVVSNDNALVNLLANKNFKELQDWVYLIHGFDYSFMEDFELPKYNFDIGLRFERYANNLWRRNASIPVRFRNISPAQFLHIESVEFIESVNKCFIKFDNASQLVIPTPMVCGRSLVKMLLIKFGRYFATDQEALNLHTCVIGNHM